MASKFYACVCGATAPLWRSRGLSLRKVEPCVTPIIPSHFPRTMTRWAAKQQKSVLWATRWASAIAHGREKHGHPSRGSSCERHSRDPTASIGTSGGHERRRLTDGHRNPAARRSSGRNEAGAGLHGYGPNVLGKIATSTAANRGTWSPAGRCRTKIGANFLGNWAAKVWSVE